MIPDSWTICRFEDIATYKTGRTPARANPAYWQEGGANVPWVTISDMNDFCLITKTKETVTPEAFDSVFHGQIVPAGTLLMSFKLTIGRIATLGIDACHNEAIISITPKSGIHPRYLGYFLSQIDYAALQDRHIKGNTLNREKINRIEIFVPPFEEQSSIADTLDLVRRAIGNQDNTLIVACNLKRATTRKLFTHGLRDESQKETEIGTLPENWRPAPFDALFDIVQGFSLKRNLSENGQGVPFLRTSNVYWGRLELNTMSHMVIDPGSIGDRDLQEGDLLVCEGGEIGRAAVWEGSGANTTFQNHLHRLRPLDPGRIVPKFAMFWLEEGFLHRGVYEGAGNRTTIPNLSRARLGDLSMPVPNLDEQCEIVTILDAIDRKIDLHRRKRAVLDDLFKALLHKLMTGKIRVSDLNLSALQSNRNSMGKSDEINRR